MIASDPQRLATALTGGDDYEVLFTAPLGAAERICELARSVCTPITPIGRITRSLQGDATHVVVLDDAGRALSFTAEGWRHFG